MEDGKDYKPIDHELNIILGEDDHDDRLLFEEAIDELPVSVKLITFDNGDDLMEWLNNVNKLPDALFLDLNMPRKNGFAALAEIKRNTKLEDLPVIIISATDKKEMLEQVYKDAAHYYIRKPANFWKLKELIYKSLKMIADKEMDLPGEASFILTTD